MSDDAQLQPGKRIRVTQTIRRRDGQWQTHVEGTVVKLEARKTGSWYAHGHDRKLWLTRLTLRKDNGELVVLSLDEHTEIAPLDGSLDPATA